MAIILYGEKKISAKEAAREILTNNCQKAAYWDEQRIVDWDKLTKKEKFEINRQLDKIFGRVAKLLGKSGYSLTG